MRKETDNLGFSITPICVSKLFQIGMSLSEERNGGNGAAVL